MLLRRLEPWVDEAAVPREDRDAVVVLVASTALLLVFEYWGRPDFYRAIGLAGWLGDRGNPTLADLVGAIGYLWWGLSSLLWRVLAPLAIGVWVLRRRPADLGYTFRGIASHLPAYGVLYLVMLPLLVWASSLDTFLTFYPFYDRAAEGGLGFWVYEAGYALQFLGVEAFFRGFMTFGLHPRLGWLAVPVMTIPYTMIHFSKPLPEAFAAIFAGLILGTMALRSRSFVPGFLLHVAVAITMDLLVLWRVGALGNVL